MKLHLHKEEFNELATITAVQIGIPYDAVIRDYYIVMLLNNLQNSCFSDKCVFKGGTSLSKCYPGSIERFSEDIDLTYIPAEELTDKQYSRALKQVEKTITEGFFTEKIESERNDRNKSSYVWLEEGNGSSCRIKLEIGSSIRPDPFSLKSMKTYIQEYLENEGMLDIVNEFGLEDISINTLDITRTFLDKVMAVKRHAICGTLNNKVRHLYDVTKLYKRDDIQKFLNNSEDLKRLVVLTKETDGFYLQKRNISKEYNPIGTYDFDKWKKHLDFDIKARYENLHKDLLYTSVRQNFDEVLDTFGNIDKIFSDIGE